MKSTLWRVVIALLFGQLLASNLIGQQEPAEPKSPQTQTAKDDSGTKLAFRLAGWKTIHTHDQKSVDSNVATLKKIGCEVVTANHGDHVDVRYRCTHWKSMELPSKELAKKWTDWLQSKGMETLIVDPAANTTNPTISYRLIKPRRMHLHDPDEVKQVVGTLELIGATVEQHSHGNHIDAVYSCPQWKKIELPNEHEARQWQDTLRQAGFEMRQLR